MPDRKVTEWAVQRLGEETPCRCGRDRFSDDGECAACPYDPLDPTP